MRRSDLKFSNLKDQMVENPCNDQLWPILPVPVISPPQQPSLRTATPNIFRLLEILRHAVGVTTKIATTKVLVPYQVSELSTLAQLDHVHT
mmetsp:Transcript_34773/g.70349  ORF Transcript_34773/g.70349 Transcript_34773/m.70349 type:complete len:91 (+) Transcript_34773:1-273(+)